MVKLGYFILFVNTRIFYIRGVLGPFFLILKLCTKIAIKSFCFLDTRSTLNY